MDLGADLGDRESAASQAVPTVLFGSAQSEAPGAPTLVGAKGASGCVVPGLVAPVPQESTIPAIANQLIRRLPTDDQRRLVAACEPVAWRLAEVLCEPGAPMRHAYFPLSGFLSLVTQAASGPGLEVGMVGREGVLGAELSLGVQHAPFHVLVQGAGSALRIASEVLLAEMALSAPLRDALKRYTGVTLSQLATSAACLRQHPASARLARWVLMSQDRAQADRFAVTSVFLDYMLGEKPQAIASAVTALQQRHLIAREGDTIAVTDRAGLESAACSCYQAERNHYQHHLGL